LAAREKLNRGYLVRIFALALLPPDILQVMLDGRRLAEFGVLVRRQGFLVKCGEQRVAVALRPN